MSILQPPDSPLSEAILRTVLYADIFNFPLTTEEIHHFLIEYSATPEAVTEALSSSRWLIEHLECAEGYWTLRGKGALHTERIRRERASLDLWPVAVRYGALLACLPFVRMVAITGALAMHNARHSQDDLDFLLITAPGRVWLARAFAVVLVRIARLKGTHLCPNYVLARSALEQEKRDLYIAHELAQMIPLAGMEVYNELRSANEWANEHLPNAAEPFYHEREFIPHDSGHVFQRFVEGLLSGTIGDRLESWERQRKLRKFAEAIQTPHASALLDAERVKGHFNDYGYPTLESYRGRLQSYGLAEETAALQME